MNSEEEVRRFIKDIAKDLPKDAFKNKEFQKDGKTFVRVWGKLPYEKATCNTGYQCGAATQYSGGWHGSLVPCKNCKRVYVLTDNGWEVSNFRQRHASGWSMFTCAVLALLLVTTIYTVFGFWWF